MAHCYFIAGSTGSTYDLNLLIDRDTALLDTQNMFNIICLFLSLFVFPVLITIFLRRASDYPETTNATDNNKRSEINRQSEGVNTCLEQIATDQTDPWQVVPRQVFTPYECLLVSVAFVVLCRVGYL